MSFTLFVVFQFDCSSSLFVMIFHILWLLHPCEIFTACFWKWKDNNYFTCVCACVCLSLLQTILSITEWIRWNVWNEFTWYTFTTFEALNFTFLFLLCTFTSTCFSCLLWSCWCWDLNLGTACCSSPGFKKPLCSIKVKLLLFLLKRKSQLMNKTSLLFPSQLPLGPSKLELFWKSLLPVFKWATSPAVADNYELVQRKYNEY